MESFAIRKDYCHDRIGEIRALKGRCNCVSSKNHTSAWGSHVSLKKSLNSSMEEIFAIVDRITNIINLELLLLALASIFCMGERLQKEKLSAGEKKMPWRTQCTEIAKKSLRDNMITLCRGKYQTLKACLILKEDIITLSSLEAHSKVCIF